MTARTAMSTGAASIGSVLLAVALVTGCGSGPSGSASDSASDSASGAAPATSGPTVGPSTTPATSPTTGPGAGATGSPGAGNSRGTSGTQQLTAIRQCLEAAGLPLPGPFPTNMDEVAGTGGRRIFADPKVQAALRACGITVPTFRPRPSGQGQGPGQAANASPPAQ